jgi:carotenoid cleavage dioxygenase-like enzyme
MVKFGGLAKLDFEEVMKVEYHMFGEKTFCTGAAFVSKEGGFQEDDGWIITFVHNEDTDISQVCQFN